MNPMQDLLARQAPPVFDNPVPATAWPSHRQKLLDTLARHEYGFSPPAPTQVKARLLAEERRAFAGKADHLKIELSFATQRGEFAFPVDLVLPLSADRAQLPNVSQRTDARLPLAVYLSLDRKSVV